MILRKSQECQTSGYLNQQMLCQTKQTHVIMNKTWHHSSSSGSPTLLLSRLDACTFRPKHRCSKSYRLQHYASCVGLCHPSGRKDEALYQTTPRAFYTSTEQVVLWWLDDGCQFLTRTSGRKETGFLISEAVRDQTNLRVGQCKGDKHTDREMRGRKHASNFA